MIRQTKEERYEVQHIEINKASGVDVGSKAGKLRCASADRSVAEQKEQLTKNNEHTPLQKCKYHIRFKYSSEIDDRASNRIENLRVIHKGQCDATSLTTAHPVEKYFLRLRRIIVDVDFDQDH